jgi:hypothetical protein
MLARRGLRSPGGRVKVLAENDDRRRRDERE